MLSFFDGSNRCWEMFLRVSLHYAKFSRTFPYSSTFIKQSYSGNMVRSVLKSVVFIWLHHVLVGACGIIAIFTVACRIFSCDMWDLVPWLGLKPGLLHWGASLSNCTTREDPANSLHGFLVKTLVSYRSCINMFSFHEMDCEYNDLNPLGAPLLCGNYSK